MSGASPWWDQGRHQDRRPRLLARNRMKAAIRVWFEADEFVEVEPGCLQVSPGNEAHLHAFKTTLTGPDASARHRYLHTSPEFAMKKLLAAGEEKIFAFAPVFRNREHSALHASEFTMLEWYRTQSPFESLYDDCAAILKTACEVAQSRYAMWRDRVCNMDAAPNVITVDDAFKTFANIDLSSTYAVDGVDREALSDQAKAQRVKHAQDDTWADLFSRILTDKVEPKLGQDQPTILTHYPAHLSALARPMQTSTKHAERFELYVCGVELANGFGELTDPVQQRTTLEAEMSLKQKRYSERYPIDEDFLAALAHMPPASGCALGFDRLVMLAVDARAVQDVMWTPTDTTT
jgi:elongation factor P--(R)-beta-lysine ligase